MRYLFIDNFRGFTRLLLPIKDVNFFVGENSAGKTSILALINLLYSPAFWFKAEFTTNEVELGHFRDIVSIKAKDKRYFHIGLIEPFIEQEEDNNIIGDGFLIRFVERDGVPTISRYTSLRNGTKIDIKFGTTKLRYKYEDNYKVRNDSASIKNMFINWIASQEKDNKGFTTLTEEDIPPTRIENLVLLEMYLNQIIRKKVKEAHYRRLFVPVPTQAMVWLAPIRTKPKRTYDIYAPEFSPAGDHIPYLIKRILSKKKTARAFIEFINRWGQESRLFESLSIKTYGRSATSPFELKITINDMILSVNNVGYGVSQALPIFVEIFNRPRGTWFAIQQPEIHIHPRAQAALGDAMFDLAVRENKRFIVETHSDFSIDSFRMNYSNKKVKNKPESQILFFERTSDGNIAYPIDILRDGELSDIQPAEFRDFFIKHQYRILGI